MSEKYKEITELIDKLRGTTPTNELQKEVEAIILADETKANVKAEADKKILEDIKTKEELLRKKTKTVVPPTEEKKEKTNIELYNEKVKTQLEADKEIEESKKEDTETIKKLTEQMSKMAEEIEALKKRKNYRTAPPKAEKVDEVADFVKQNITRNFEMIV